MTASNSEAGKVQAEPGTSQTRKQGSYQRLPEVRRTHKTSAFASLCQ